MDERTVIGILLAVCAAMLFLGAVPYYVIRHVGPGKIPPLPRGNVRIVGFDLIDVIGISLFFAFYALQWVATGMAEGKTELSKMENLPLRLFEALCMQGGLIVVVVALLFWRMKLADAFGLRGRRHLVYLVLAPLVVPMMWAFIYLLDVVGYNAWIMEMVDGDGKQEAVKLLAENKDPLTLVMMAAVACIGAPLAEEVVFRGYIYAAIKRFTNIPFAVIFTALLFGAVHLQLLQLLPLVVLGVILALAYEFTGSLWAPIAIHFFFNASTTVIQLMSNLNPEMLEKMSGSDGALIGF